MEARLFQLRRPNHGSAADWEVVNPQLGGLPISKTQLDNYPPKKLYFLDGVLDCLVLFLHSDSWNKWSVIRDLLSNPRNKQADPTLRQVHAIEARPAGNWDQFCKVDVILVREKNANTSEKASDSPVKLR